MVGSRLASAHRLDFTGRHHGLTMYTQGWVDGLATRTPCTSATTRREEARRWATRPNAPPDLTALQDRRHPADVHRRGDRRDLEVVRDRGRAGPVSPTTASGSLFTGSSFVKRGASTRRPTRPAPRAGRRSRRQRAARSRSPAQKTARSSRGRTRSGVAGRVTVNRTSPTVELHCDILRRPYSSPPSSTPTRPWAFRGRPR